MYELGLAAGTIPLSQHARRHVQEITWGLWQVSRLTTMSRPIGRSLPSFQMHSPLAASTSSNTDLILYPRQPVNSQRLMLWAARFGKQEVKSASLSLAPCVPSQQICKCTCMQVYMDALGKRHFEQRSSASHSSTLLDVIAEAPNPPCPFHRTRPTMWPAQPQPLATPPPRNIDPCHQLGLSRSAAEQFLQSDELEAEVWRSYGSTIRWAFPSTLTQHMQGSTHLQGMIDAHIPSH